MSSYEQIQWPVIQKLISCEEDFVLQMQKGSQRYLYPLKEEFLSPEQHWSVFQNLEEVRLRCIYRGCTTFFFHSDFIFLLLFCISSFQTAIDFSINMWTTIPTHHNIFDISGVRIQTLGWNPQALVNRDSLQTILLVCYISSVLRFPWGSFSFCATAMCSRNIFQIISFSQCHVQELHRYLASTTPSDESGQQEPCGDGEGRETLPLEGRISIGALVSVYLIKVGKNISQ